MLEAWTSELTPSMMPDGLCKAIAKEIGTDNLLKVAVLIGGGTVYFPKAEGILRPLRDMKIKEEYDHYNTEELSKKYNVTQRRVRQLVGEKRPYHKKQ